MGGQRILAFESIEDLSAVERSMIDRSRYAPNTALRVYVIGTEDGTRRYVAHSCPAFAAAEKLIRTSLTRRSRPRAGVWAKAARWPTVAPMTSEVRLGGCTIECATVRAWKERRSSVPFYCLPFPIDSIYDKLRIKIRQSLTIGQVGRDGDAKSRFGNSGYRGISSHSRRCTAPDKNRRGSRV